MTQAAILAASGSPGTTTGFKNRIINGAMVIDQRNAGASVSVTDSNQYTLDRWQGVSATSASKFTVQQSTVAPAGFANSLLATSSSSYTVGSTEYFFVRQKIEGFNTADLMWGTADAKTVTISFWVRSSLTGNFGASVVNSANSYAYLFNYTINAANTWEQKSVTVAGPTAGSWVGSTNGIGLQLKLSLGVGSTYSGTANVWTAADLAQPTGSVSVVGTSGATWYITGVQLEVGTTATNFDFRNYGQELDFCLRYYQKLANSDFLPAVSFSTNRVLSGVPYTGRMRAQPTATAAANSFIFFPAGAAFTSSAVAYSPNTTGFITIDATCAGSGAGVGSLTSTMELSAEL